MAKKQKKEPKAKSIKTYVNFILDESGSMISQWHQAINGFNEYVQNLKREGGDVRLTLTKFNTACTILFNGVKLEDVEPLSINTYTPDGMTALYDSIGKTLQSIKEPKKNVRYLTIIFTDGDENSSKEFTHPKIVDLIQSKEKEGNWTFVYLGATQDAWNVGASFGINPGNVVRYSQSNIKGAINAVANSTTHLMRGVSMNTTSFCSDNAKDYLKVDAIVAKTNF